jgi:hypothetical protein
LVSSPNIKGGSYQNLAGDTCFGLGADNNRFSFVLADSFYKSGVFKIFNGDGGIISLIGKGFEFLNVDAGSKTVTPKGTWNFKDVTVTAVFG